MPSLAFRSSVVSEPAFASPPTSPQLSMSMFSYDAALMDFPFLLPSHATTSASSITSSSPSSSPISPSTDDSSDFGSSDASHWRPAGGGSSTGSGDGSTSGDGGYSIAGGEGWTGLGPPSMDRNFFYQPPPPAGPSSHSDQSSNRSSSASLVAEQLASASSSNSMTFKRKRSCATLSAEQRLQRRRAQHRAVDANRRQKENEAIARLHVLIRQQQQQQLPGAGVDNDVDDDSAEGDEDCEGRKAGRLAVLESSIALIEQLTTACQRMEVACNAKDAQVSRVSSQLHSVAAVIAQQASSLALAESMDKFARGLSTAECTQSWLPAHHHSSPPTHPSLLAPAKHPHCPTHPHSSPSQSHSASSVLAVLPPSTSSFLLQSDATHALRQATTSLLETMLMTIVALPSKVVIEVNDMFLRVTGFKRTEMLYRPLDEVTTKNVPQYPASLAALNDVMEGSLRQGTAIWRCRWANGLLYENRVTFFAIFDKPCSSSGGVGGGTKHVPDKMLLMSAPEESVLYDQSGKLE